MKKLFIYATIALFFFASCTEKNIADIETDKDEIASFQDYFSFLQEETTVNIFIQSYSGSVQGDTDPIPDISASIEGNKKPINIEIENRLYTFNEYDYSDLKKRTYTTYSPDYRTKDLQEIYGKKFKIDVLNDKLKATGTFESSTTVKSVYIPELIRADFQGLVNGNIVPGTKVTWNADGLNTNGIVVGIEYSASSQYDKSITTNYPDHIMEGYTLPDNGEYTFKASDFIDYPDKADLDFYVARAGFGVTIDNAGKDYKISAMTVSSRRLTIQKK